MAEPSKDSAIVSSRTELREFGFIAYAIERMFYYLGRLPPWRWHGARGALLTDEENQPAARRKYAMDRAHSVDMHVTISLCLELASLIAVGLYDQVVVRIAVTALAGWRVLNIFVVAVNMALFNGLRIRRPHMMASLVRTIVLVGINYVELIACFGIVYASWPSMLDSTDSTGGVREAL